MNEIGMKKITKEKYESDGLKEKAKRKGKLQNEKRRRKIKKT